MKEIQLTQGKVALVDDEDFERLNQYKWYALKDRTNWYAIRRGSYKVYKKDVRLRMHQEVLNTTSQVDHKNGNGLDNRKENLRGCTHKNNSRNKRKTISLTSSIYKGVRWRLNRSYWEAFIKVDGKQLYLGFSHNEKEAAQMYNDAAIKHFGEFANLNDILS